MSTPLNVIFLPSWYPVKQSPLNGIFNKELAELISETHNVVLLHITYDNVKQIEIAEIKHHSQFSETIISIPEKGNFMLRQWRYFSVFFNFIKEKRKQMHINLVHVQVSWKMGILAWLAKWRYRYPYIVTEHYTGYLPDDAELQGYKRNLSFFVLKNAKRVTTVSENLEQVLRKDGVKRIQTIYNCIHDVFLNVNVGSPDLLGKFRFIHVSNFNDRQKQTGEIIQAFIKLHIIHPNTELLLILPELRYHEFKCQHTDWNFDGIHLERQSMNRDDYCHVLSECHCLISYSKYETFGLTVAEAICAGVPVIYTECGGPESYVEPRMGIKVDKNNPATLLSAMTDLTMNYPFDRHEIARAARARFDKSQILLQYSMLYKSLLK